MRQREEEVERAGLKVLVVTFEAGPAALKYTGQTDLPWPILVDEDRSLYGSYGMHRGRWWKVWGLSTAIVYAKLMLRGRRPRLPATDPFQLGGDVLIDPEGIVRLHHIGSGPADRPDVSSILARVR